jgi:diadenosine tetraphosphate (Ap4A) HIT family hydrolase
MLSPQKSFSHLIGAMLIPFNPMMGGQPPVAQFRPGFDAEEKVGDMKAGVLYLFKDQAHKGRCALALKNHKKELCECDPQERNDFCEDLAKASGAIKKLWGCTKINLGSFGDTNPHLHFHIVPKYEGGFEFGGSFAITNPEPVLLKDEEYAEMIEALEKELGI